MTEDQVREMMRQAGLESGFGWVCAYLAKVATARRNDLPLSEGPKGFVQRVIDGIKEEVHRDQFPGKQYIQKKILSSLSHGGDWQTDTVTDLDLIAQFPESPVLSKDGEASMRLEFLRTTYATELARLTHVRTVVTENRGALLAEMAEQMEGYFQWIEGGRLDPKTRLPSDKITRNNVVIYENDFIKWLKTDHTTSPLTAISKMNCWEAVFVAACYAALIGYEDLRRIHGFGTKGPAASEDAHDRRILKALGFYDSFKIVKEIDLVPSRGDIIFASGHHHVMICLGSGIVNGISGTHAMSLWNKPTNQFCWMMAETVENALELRFVPCPF